MMLNILLEDFLPKKREQEVITKTAALAISVWQELQSQHIMA